MIRDGCLVNGVAATHMSLINHRVLDIICLSHSSSVAGTELNHQVPLAEKFISRWCSLLSFYRLAKMKFKVR